MATSFNKIVYSLDKLCKLFYKRINKTYFFLDEVHLQHSFAFMKALNEEGVLYRSQIYPDGTHYLDDVRLHLYKSIESFLIDSFALNEFSTHLEAFMKMKSFKTPT